MASFKKAIENKCKDCIYDSSIPLSWRKQVTMCSCYSCPLFPVRPLSSADIVLVEEQFNRAQGT